jgi:transposase, IS5 family
LGTQKKFEFRYSEAVIDSFLESDLGELWQVLPLGSLASSVSLPEPKSSAGRPGWFDVEEALSVMFLKHYEAHSDAKIIENLNLHIGYQLFSGVVLAEGQVIKDTTLLSSWRSKFGHHMDAYFFQSILQYHWKEYISDKNVCKMDASCMESYLTYPTSIKLLWRALEWLNTRIKEICKKLKRAKPRNKFKQQKHKQREYQLLKKPSHPKRLKRQKALLHHVGVMINQLEFLATDHLKTRHQERLLVIKAMYEQQQQYFNQPESKIENRIVSLHKPYVRPIVRGKENKPLEFGSKIHLYQVDNFDFIEYIDFNNFNETTRFESTIDHHQVHFGEVKQAAADRIYHTNKNRTICKDRNIHHNFTPKGTPPKDPTIAKQKRKLREILSTDRGTRQEGAFGNIKNHYLGRANKARTQENEMIWIFFCVHTANAAKIRKKILDKTITSESQ